MAVAFVVGRSAYLDNLDVKCQKKVKALYYMLDTKRTDPCNSLDHVASSKTVSESFSSPGEMKMLNHQFVSISQ
jgi:hypothetical protein